jgi:DNA (cytosine-5)-methyltransferase 1
MEFLRVIRETLPKAFVMENVKGLKNWNSGHALETILKLFSEPFQYDGKDYQYTVAYDCLNAVDYGVPQKRERIFIVGSLMKKTFTFPEPTHFNPDESKNTKCKWKTVGDALESLPEPDAPSAAAQRVSKTIKNRHKKFGYE